MFSEEEESDRFADAPSSNVLPPKPEVPIFKNEQIDSQGDMSDSDVLSEDDEDGFLEEDMDRVYAQDWEDVSGGTHYSHSHN